MGGTWRNRQDRGHDVYGDGGKERRHCSESVTTFLGTLYQKGGRIVRIRMLRGKGACSMSRLSCVCIQLTKPISIFQKPDIEAEGGEEE